MNWPLFKATVKANWIVAVIFALLVLIYVSVSISMFDPESAEELEAMLDLFPEVVLKVVGFVNLGTDLTGYLANYLFGFIMIVFPMIYCIVMANRVIAKHVDSGAMAYLLTTPNTRARIAATQGIFLALSLFLIVVVSFSVAVVLSAATFPGLLDVATYASLNWITFLALLVGGAIGFVASCSFNETRLSLAVGATIPALFFVFRMLSTMSEQVEWLRFLSVYSFVDVERILQANGYAVAATAVLVPVAAALFGAGVWIFHRRSLPL